MEPRDVVRLLIATGVIDKTGAVNVDKLRGCWSIEDGGRKITRAREGEDDNQRGKQRGGNGGIDADRR